MPFMWTRPLTTMPNWMQNILTKCVLHRDCSVSCQETLNEEMDEEEELDEIYYQASALAKRIEEIVGNFSISANCLKLINFITGGFNYNYIFVYRAHGYECGRSLCTVFAMQLFGGQLTEEPLTQGELNFLDSCQSEVEQLF